MKIALCDDDLGELKKIKKTVDEYIFSKEDGNLLTIDMFTNGNDLLSHISKHGGYDLLILDIIMPGLNGIELAQEIRSSNGSCIIIFLTSSPEFAVDSYKVNAFYYLLKPFSETELSFLIRRVFTQVEKEESASFVVKEAKRLTRIHIHTIQFVESVKHTIHFHLHKDEEICCYGSLSEYQDILLSDNRFIQCHRSFIVNMQYVMNISNRNFVFNEKTLVPISKQYYQQVKKSYIDYYFYKGTTCI